MSFLKKLFGRKEEPKKESVVEQETTIIESEHAVDQSQVLKEDIQEISEEVKEEIKNHVEKVAQHITDESKDQPIDTMIERELSPEKQEVKKIVQETESAHDQVELVKDQQTDLEVETSVVAEQEETVEVEVKEELPVQEEHVEAQNEILQEEQPKKKGLFSKLFNGLSKTRDNILGSVDEVLKSFKKIDEDLYEELEEALIMADFGVDTTMEMMDQLRKLVKERKLTEPSELKATLQEIITGILTAYQTSPIIDETKPNVVLVIGVNGVGKTTTIGKLSNQLKADNKKVVLAAADTFRAAAIEQLQIWADRAAVDLIKQAEGSDPASVVYDGIQAAKARKADVLICDTAGRLQNKTNLMKELEKISRIIEREYPEAHKEVLIVLDATTGQNAISQVKVFKEVAKVDGIVLTKLDGTAKGGAIVGICSSLGVPVKYIGVGEKIEDLQVFDPENFAKALFHVE